MGPAAPEHYGGPVSACDRNALNWHCCLPNKRLHPKPSRGRQRRLHACVPYCSRLWTESCPSAGGSRWSPSPSPTAKRRTDRCTLSFRRVESLSTAHRCATAHRRRRRRRSAAVDCSHALLVDIDVRVDRTRSAKLPSATEPWSVCFVRASRLGGIFSPVAMLSVARRLSRGMRRSRRGTISSL